MSNDTAKLTDDEAAKAAAKAAHAADAAGAAGFDLEGMRQRVLACPEGHKRDAVLTNLEHGMYKRASDVERDIEWLGTHAED